MIRLKCPTCARTIGIDEAHVGKPALCPVCGSMFTVPAPAVLLDEAPASLSLAPPPLSPASPAVNNPRLPPLETFANPTAPPAGPLLPDDLIPLTHDPAHSRKSWAMPGEDFGPGLARESDAWERSDAHLRLPVPEQPLPRLPPAPSAPGQPAVAEPDLPPPGEEVKDWNFLTLDDAAPAPAAPPETAPAAKPPPALPPLPPLPPPDQPEEEDLILLPLEEPAASEPILLPLADAPAPPPPPRDRELVGAEALLPLHPEPVGPLVAEPVLDDETPAVLPAAVEPMPVPATGVVLPVLVETVVVPTAAPPAGAPLNYGLNPPPLVAEPVARPPEELDWGEDVNRVDPRAVDRDPSRPRKKRRVYGAVSLIPGLDDFYLGLIVLGVIWLLLAILMIASPRLCLVPIIVGGLIWVCATFWLNVAVQEADPYMKIPFLTPVITTPLSFLIRQPGLFVAGIIFAQIWAAFFALYFRDRALRAFLVTCLGMLIAGMGWAAMPRGPAEESAPQVQNWRP
jgi:hypothetical protein